jgi:hypothetical protein
MTREEQLTQILQALTSGAVNQVQQTVESSLASWDSMASETRERFQANLAAVLSSLAATKSALTSMAVLFRQVQATNSEWKLWQAAATTWKTLVNGLGLGDEEARRMAVAGEEYGSPILIPVLLFGATVMVSAAAVAWAWAVVEIAEALQGWVQAYNNELSARVEASKEGRSLPPSDLKTPGDLTQSPSSKEDNSTLLWLAGLGVVIGGVVWATSRGR